MGISTKLLGEGEHVVAHTRTHLKAMVLPALILIVTCFVAALLIGMRPDGTTGDVLLWVIIGVGVLVVLWFCVRPLLRWLTSTYTLTNRRLIARRGIITRTGRDIPLYRVNDVSYERGLLDRMLGCGTLVVAVANEDGATVLHDVPQVERLQVQISELLFGPGEEAEDDEGPGVPPGTPPTQPRFS